MRGPIKPSGEIDHGIHGIDLAFYAGGHGDPYYQPVLTCPCGYSTGRSDSWEDAGSKLDQHLKEHE